MPYYYSCTTSIPDSGRQSTSYSPVISRYSSLIPHELGNNGSAKVNTNLCFKVNFEVQHIHTISVVVQNIHTQ